MKFKLILVKIIKYAIYSKILYNVCEYIEKIDRIKFKNIYIYDLIIYMI